MVQSVSFPSELACLQRSSEVPPTSSIAQLSPYLGEDGLVRVRGRLQESNLSFDAKHPVIVPNGHLALLIVRFAHYSNKHLGVGSMISHVRRSYWVIGLRRLAKRVKRECVFCRRYDTLPENRPVAPLPGFRIQQSPPFTACGLDYAGLQVQCMLPIVTTNSISC